MTSRVLTSRIMAAACGGSLRTALAGNFCRRLTGCCREDVPRRRYAVLLGPRQFFAIGEAAAALPTLRGACAAAAVILAGEWLRKILAPMLQSRQWQADGARQKTEQRHHRQAATRRIGRELKEVETHASR